VNAPAGRSVFIPGLLLGLAVAGWSGFQTFQLVIERGNLAGALANQEPQVEQSRKVRAALESVATKTARIARDGNPNATVVVEELRKRGLTIDLDAPPAEPAPAP